MIKPLCFLLLLTTLFTELFSQTNSSIDDLSTLAKCQKLGETGKTQAEKDELQKDYWTLLGVVSDLATYRQAFLKN